MIDQVAGIYLQNPIRGLKRMRTPVSVPIGIFLLLMLVCLCTAITPGEEIQLKVNYIIALLLCSIWFILGLLATVTLILSGATYLTTGDMEERKDAKSRMLKVFVGLAIVLAACPIINYLIHGTRMDEFKCDCPPTPPPSPCDESYPNCDGYCPTGYECVGGLDNCTCEPELTTTTVI